MQDRRKEQVGEGGEGGGELAAEWRAEVVRVVKRLEVIVEDHERAAERLGVVLDGAMVLGVLGALRAELRGEEVGPWLADGDEIRRHVGTALFQELLDEPSNVFVATRVDADTMRYEAMPAVFWERCLDGLERVLLGL
jgi:hypothetical protein